MYFYRTKKRYLWIGLSVVISSLLIIFFVTKMSSAALISLIPETTLSNAGPWTLNGCSAPAHNCVNEGATPNTSNYLSTGTSLDTTAASLQFEMTNASNVATATKVQFFIYAKNASNSSGSDLDTLTMKLDVGSDTFTSAAVAPPYNSWAWYMAEYTGSWSQAQVNDMQTMVTRNVVGGGSPSSRDDEIQIATVVVQMTYDSTLTLDQASYRWTGNDMAGDGTFATKVDYSTTGGATSVASADFNGDGNVDIAAANDDTAGTLSILLGNGDGTLNAKTDYTTGGRPQSVVHGDFNGDGDIDLATANYVGDNISVLLGNGDGTFATKVDYVSGNGANSLVATDFNNDDITDLAVVHRLAGSMVAFLGVGDGTFVKDSFVHGTGDYPSGVTSADFNGDGKADVAVSNEDTSNVTVHMGNGDGTFVSRVSYGAGLYPMAITSADFNGDGKADLAVPNEDSPGTISVLMNNGDGTFAARVTYDAGTFPASLKAVDFNGDNHADLVSSNKGGDIALVFLNTGNGTFAPKVDYATGDMPQFVGANDLNNDTITDLLVLNDNATVSVLLGNAGAPNQSLAAQDTVATAPAAGEPFRLRLNIGAATGDLAPGMSFKLRYQQKSGSCSTDPAAYSDITTGSPIKFYDNESLADGTPYLSSTLDPVRAGVTAIGQTYEEVNPFNSSAAVSGGQDALWDFALTTDSVAMPGTYCIIAVKVDDSGLNTYTAIPEIIVPDPPIEQAAYRWTADDGTPPPGAFTSTVEYAMDSSAHSVTATDIDGDDAIDLAIVVPNGTSNVVSVLLGNGDGTFAAKVDYETGTFPRSVIATDVNGDNSVDLVVASSSSSAVSVHTNNGDGTFAAKVDYATGSVPYDVTAADINSDGLVDLATANSIGDSMSVLLNNGDGTFAAKVDYLTGDSSRSIESADFNGDGKNDLIVASSGPDMISLFLGNGDGTFAAKVDYTTARYPVDVIAADFNRDGIVDIASANSFANNTSIFLGNGDGTFAAKTDYAVANSPQAIAAVDLNGDLIIDLSVANSSSDSVSIFLGNGDGTFAAKTDYAVANSPQAVAAADFNNDRVVDLAFANTSGQSGSVHLGTPGSPSTPLAAKNTVAVSPSANTAFRLRLNLGVLDGTVGAGMAFKLRYQQKSGASCSTDPSTYSDITTSSSIKFYDSSRVDGSTYFMSDIDPTRLGAIAVGQTYHESNPFTTTQVIPSGRDGLWDFALTMDASAPAGSYCLVATKADGTALNTYNQYPEITFGTVGPTIEQQLRGGQSVVRGVKRPFNW